MTFPEIPKTLDFGAGDVVEVKYLEQVFDISRRTAILYLKALRIKPLYVDKNVFFSLDTLKRILFILSKPGSPGFIFPGSAAKNNPRFTHDSEYITEVTQDILDSAADPKTLAEMAGASGRNVDILKKFLTNPAGRPRKEKPHDG